MSIIWVAVVSRSVCKGAVPQIFIFLTELTLLCVYLLMGHFTNGNHVSHYFFAHFHLNVKTCLSEIVE